MKAYPVPEKWVGMWLIMAKAIDDAQVWLVDAHKAKDKGKVHLYTKMVADRISAIGNLQRLAFGNLIENLSKDRGRVAIHTNVQTEPPAMLVYDNDEEFYAETSTFRDDVERDGVEGIQVFGMTSLKNPVKPMNPEGMD